MKLWQEELAAPPGSRGLRDLTAQVNGVVERAGVATGLCNVFLQHTSASLLVQENADPAVLRDLERFVDRLTPEDQSYEHGAEGPDDMPAHLRAALLRTAESIPVRAGRLALGTWQSIYLWEHRRARRARTLVVTVIGEP